MGTELHDNDPEVELGTEFENDRNAEVWTEYQSTYM